MNTNPKIWLCGQTSSVGQIGNIKPIIEIAKYFDGLCWTVNYQDNSFIDDGVFDLLNSHKNQGEIIKMQWRGSHAIGMNAFLKSPLIKINDWIFSIDAQELPKKEWLENMRDFIAQCEEQNVNAIYWNRPYLFKKTYGMEYVGEPHCWPQPMQGNYINIADETKVVREENAIHFGDFIYNKKSFDDTMIRHAAKYWFYEISNEIINQYSKSGKKIIQEKEISRRQFKQYLWDNYDVYSYNDFIKFINKVGIKQIDELILKYIEHEKVLKSAIRLDIFKHNRETILLEQNNWSLVDFIKNL